MSVENDTDNVFELDDVRARRNASELPADQYKHSGAHLAAVREASGISLIDAAERTHIKQSHLDAIEQMNVVELPPRPYAIGFVKTYAEFLELDAGSIVSRFKVDAGFTPTPVIETEKFDTSETGSAEEEKPELSLYAVVAVIAFILWCSYQITLPARQSTSIRDGGTDPVAAVAPVLANVSLTDEITPPQAIETIDPIYPRNCAATAASIEAVEVTFSVTASGRIAAEKIFQSSNDCFDNAALNALRRWRFSPQTVNGEPRTAVSQRFRFEFDRP